MLEYESGIIANKEHVQVVTIVTTQVEPSSSTKTVNASQSDQSKPVTTYERKEVEDKTNNSIDDVAAEQSHDINGQQETTSDGSLKQESDEQVSTNTKGHEVTAIVHSDVAAHEISKDDDEVGSSTLCPGQEEDITCSEHLLNGEVLDEETLTVDRLSRAPCEHLSLEVCVSSEDNKNQQEREEIVVQAEVLPQKEYETVCIVEGTNPRMRELRMVRDNYCLITRLLFDLLAGC